MTTSPHRPSSLFLDKMLAFIPGDDLALSPPHKIHETLYVGCRPTTRGKLDWESRYPTQFVLHGRPRPFSDPDWERPSATKSSLYSRPRRVSQPDWNSTSTTQTQASESVPYPPPCRVVSDSALEIAHTTQNQTAVSPRHPISDSISDLPPHKQHPLLFEPFQYRAPTSKPKLESTDTAQTQIPASIPPAVPRRVSESDLELPAHEQHSLLFEPIQYRAPLSRRQQTVTRQAACRRPQRKQNGLTGRKYTPRRSSPLTTPPPERKCHVPVPIDLTYSSAPIPNRVSLVALSPTPASEGDARSRFEGLSNLFSRDERPTPNILVLKHHYSEDHIPPPFEGIRFHRHPQHNRASI